MKGGSGCHLTDHLSSLEQWSNITLFLQKTYRDYINLVQKSCQVCFSVMPHTRGRIRKGDIEVADIEELERMHASEIHARRLNAKEVLSPMKGDNFIFPISDGTAKISGGDRRLRTSTLIRERRERGEEQEILRGESDGLSSPIPFQDDSTPDDAEAKNHFWTITGEFIYRHLVEPRVKLYPPEEESFPVLLKYIDVTRITDTTLDVMLEKHIEDYWNADEDRELSDAWTGFTRFLILNERPRDGYTWSRERLTRKQTTSRPDKVWPDMWKHMSDAARRKAKQKWAIEKPKLDNARKLRGIFFIEPEDEEFQDIMKNARRKSEIPMPAAMLCKTRKNSGPRYWEKQDQICLYCRS